MLNDFRFHPIREDRRRSVVQRIACLATGDDFLGQGIPCGHCGRVNTDPGGAGSTRFSKTRNRYVGAAAGLDAPVISHSDPFLSSRARCPPGGFGIVGSRLAGARLPRRRGRIQIISSGARSGSAGKSLVITAGFSAIAGPLWSSGRARVGCTLG